MKRLSLALILLSATVAGHAQVTPTPRELLKQLIDVLNAHEEGKIRTFVQQWLVPNAPVDQRVQRWMDLGDQGAPFKVVGDGPATDEEVDAIVVDRMENRIAFRMHLEAKPSLKIKGLQLAPAMAIEGAPAIKWTALGDLAVTLGEKAKSPAMGIGTIRDGKLDVAVEGVREVGKPAKVELDDVWSIGSIGKPVCSTIIGRLIEQGKLRWDETLKEALPGVPMQPGYEKVTLEQIMHHRGGIPEDGGFRRAQVVEIVGSAKTPTEIRANYIKNILGRAPIAPPDTRFAYSNAGYALLSAIAEKATGTPYEQLVKGMIFDPLGLKHSYVGGESLPSARPSGHIEGPDGLRTQEMGGPMESMFAGAGGGLYMSLGDLAKFAELHLNGLNGKDGLLKASTIERLHQGVLEQSSGTRKYACGWGIQTIPGIQTFDGHNGSNGTMRAEMAIFPKSNLVVVAFVNRGGESEPSPGLEAVMAVGQRYAPRK